MVLFDPEPEFPFTVDHQVQAMQSDTRSGGPVWTRRWGNAKAARVYGLGWDHADLATIARIRSLWTSTRGGAGEMTWRPVEDVRKLFPALATAIRVKFWGEPSISIRHGAVDGTVRVQLAEVVPGG